MSDIELVIKIPEEIYLNAKTDMLCGTDAIVNAIKNGAPLPKLIGGIKAEIRKEISDYEGGGYEFSEGIIFGLRKALKIINKHIKQKGK